MLRKTILTIFFSLFLLTYHQAFAQKQVNAYVTTDSNNVITVIDVSTDTVATTITVGGCVDDMDDDDATNDTPQDLSDIIIDPSGTKLYVICNEDRVFSVNLVTGEQNSIDEVNSNSSNSEATYLAISPNGDFVFVGDGSESIPSVTVINARTDEVVTILNDIDGSIIGRTIEGLAVSRDSNYLFVGIDDMDGSTTTIYVYDLTGTSPALVDFDTSTPVDGDTPADPLTVADTTTINDMIVSPDGSTLFVSGVNNDGTTYGDNVVRAFTINSPPTATAALLVTTDDLNTEDGMPGDNFADYVRGMAFGPDGSLYVASAGDEGLNVARFAPDAENPVSCSTGVTAPDGLSREVAVSPDGSKVYVALAPAGRDTADPVINICSISDFTVSAPSASGMIDFEPDVAGDAVINIVMGPGFYSSQNDRVVAESQLNAYYDLDNRRSFIQLTNLSNTAARTVNVQIFQNGGADGCSDSSFIAEIPTSSTVVYNLDNLQDQEIDLGDSHGYVVVTPVTVDMEGAITGIDGTAELIGNFRIIDNAGYEYRTNMQSIRLGPATFPVAIQIPNFVANFNNASGANQADVVGFGYTNRVSGNGAVRNMAGGVSFDVSCGTDRVTFACGGVMSHGISSDFGASKGDSVICSGEQIDAEAALTAGSITFTGGTAPTAMELLDGAFSGYIGINNGNGTGSMDSWVRTTP